MKAQVINLILAIILFPISAYLIVVYGSWQLLLGIFLFTWANNIGIKNK